ncbi:capsule assembly Wzi family protein [Marinobacter xiaoshiensis]|uniref:Capsule assembly Wzi family protein n=1 Tax=Marinobacter xiaoshiensis TaxID=3073652 RepID=A0ABU2HEE7_9GAMM|nr:capsule assembly Wzi family protein [Marinobacter sp. F60267]MDS1309444.1 capsule assembly Wzi family protein [Marinobacter sp. F60267]
MTLKHWALVGGAVACLAAGFVSAAPWVSAGDAAARHKLQKRADSGQLNRTVTTWPVMKDSVGVSRQAGPKYRLSVSGSTENWFINSYSDNSSEEGQVRLTAEYDGGWWAAGMSPAVVASPGDDDAFRLDQSYLTVFAGNWVLGAGAIDRWWGPGWQNSLILSNNARPAPGLWLNRNEAQPFETPLLSWLGPWQLTAMVSQLESDRAVADPLLVGFRGTFRPIDGLDIGLARTFIFGGDGRSSSLSTFWDAFIGNDNPRDSSEDPSNQLGAVDVRYGFEIGEQTLALYGQMMGEDEAGGFPARKSWLFGLDATTSLWGREQRWFLEGTDTLADNLFGSPMPDISYEHRVYRTGYRYKGRNMAATIDSDSQIVTLGYFDFLGGGNSVGASVSWVDFTGNPESRVTTPNPAVTYFVPARDQSIMLYTGFWEFGTPYGTVRIAGQIAEDKIALHSGELDQWSLFARWSYGF